MIGVEDKNDELSNVFKAAAVSIVAHCLALVYLLVIWLMSKAPFSYGWILIIWGTLFAFLALGFMAPIISARRGSDHVEARIMRIALYVWSYLYLVFLSYIVWNTGGLFGSKFTWLFEVSIVATLQLTIFSSDNEKWKSPATFTLFILLLYICIQLWPERPLSQLPPTSLALNWVQAIAAIFIILSIQLAAEWMHRCDCAKLIYKIDESPERK